MAEYGIHDRNDNVTTTVVTCARNDEINPWVFNALVRGVSGHTECHKTRDFLIYISRSSMMQSRLLEGEQESDPRGKKSPPHRSSTSTDIVIDLTHHYVPRCGTKPW